MARHNLDLGAAPLKAVVARDFRGGDLGEPDAVHRARLLGVPRTVWTQDALLAQVLDVNGGGSSPGVLGTGGDGAGLSGVSDGGAGVLAESTSGVGVSASSTKGVGATGTSEEEAGVSGEGGGDRPGVRGAGGDGPGVFGTRTDSHGVRGKGGRENAGVLGECTLGPGVKGGSDQSYGVEAHGATGLYAKGTERAALLDGDVVITGTVSDSVNIIRIDHPTEPENRFLVHAAVESPELKDVYDGRATVELPEWFESLNESFRYQLTAIGAPAPELHVSRPLADHTFAIAGGGPGLEACWQVTGVRCDHWARAHPLPPPEEEKPPAQKGRFLHPELLGHPADRSLSPYDRARLPAGPRAMEG
ncbi:hypothetical protein ACFWGM_26380 [Streptomyces roseolus]|uniref:hypothetical protein n=1 Tax=Streptomyces roseolus TaxID=67358 RepID=UPI0036258748